MPVTDWADGDTVDLYAQWKKPEHLKPVVDNEPFVPTDPDTPPERVDDGFDADFGADPDPLPEGMMMPLACSPRPGRRTVTKAPWRGSAKGLFAAVQAEM